MSVTILDRCRVRDSCHDAHTEFTVRLLKGESETIVKRRYNEFADLHMRLRPMMKDLPEMPPKGVLSKMSESFMRRRQHALGLFLEAALSADPSLRNLALRDFLGLRITFASDLSHIRDSSTNRPDWLPSLNDIPKTHKTAADMRPAWLDDAYAEILTNCSTASTEPSLDELPCMLACEAPVTRPDFTGCWILARVEGSMDLLLKELEISWVLRKAAAAMGYGVGKARTKITQQGNLVEIENQNPVKTFRRTIFVDGAEHDETIAGRPVRTIADWKGSVLVTDSQNLKTLKKFPKCVRYLDGRDMITEYVFPDGQTVKQSFSK